MKAESIELIEELAQHEYDGQFYDFHNDYDCKKVVYENGDLVLTFVNVQDKLEALLVFKEVLISKSHLSDSGSEDRWIIDTVYRGRAEKDGRLVELSDDGKSYFYLDFVEGFSMEFWSTEVQLICI